MPDEQETTTETTDTVETVATETETVEVKDEAEERLDRIIAQRLGKYAAKAKLDEDEKQQLRERLARLEGAASARPADTSQAQPAAQFYTPEQLQAAVDSARITPAAMAAQLAWQQKELGKKELREEFRHEQKRGSALSEVNQYIEKIPALGNQSSTEFAKVRRAAFEIADEMGLDVTDPRVQRRALRETFGTLDRVAQTTQLRDFDRKHADTSIETQGGGGSRQPSSDPFKHVPKPLMDHWKARGLSVEEMKKQLPYVDLDKWKRRG